MGSFRIYFFNRIESVLRKFKDSVVKFAFLLRPSAKDIWGGDINVLNQTATSLKKLGHQIEFSTNINDCFTADYIFLCNALFDYQSEYHLIKLLQKKYGFFLFYEDVLEYMVPCYGFFHYVHLLCEEKKYLDLEVSLERLLENPKIVYFFHLSMMNKGFYLNYPVIKDAHICLTNSFKEKEVLLRDCPRANVNVLHWGYELYKEKITNSFLEFTGLTSKSYMLQVGRLEPRKNQLATILATRNIDIPLVFIATKKEKQMRYHETCIEAIKKYRKAPTIIISENLPEMEYKHLKILSMPNHQKLPESMMKSAFYHAGLHVHPAFCELPGLTYLESLEFGIPTIASSLATIKDYFIDQESGRYLLDDRMEYCNPYDLNSLTELIEKKWGQTFEPNTELPAFQRSYTEVAKEILELTHS